ncbi:MAG: hypothetical protein M2R45_00106 [Verrucomicrobia subdivision 3 bacterium]|nr:hypothetical protein [Limisphaerales bacterium]MCS1412434.1 hypothetical protein [Limisphaerales bacterium]
MLSVETNFIPIFAAIADLESSISAKILYQVTGFVIVLTVLMMLWAAISLIGAIFSRFPVEKPPAPPKSVASPVKQPITPQHIAAIIAALHTVIKEPYQITSIEEAPEKKST